MHVALQAFHVYVLSVSCCVLHGLYAAEDEGGTGQRRCLSHAGSSGKEAIRTTHGIRGEVAVGPMHCQYKHRV